MNPIAVVIELMTNAIRLVRNLLVRLLPAPEFVVMYISGTLPERRPPSPSFRRRLAPLPTEAVPQESLEEWRERLAALAGDPRVKGLVLELGLLQAGLTSLESLRAALERFRAAGKRIIAYLPTASLPAYYLASVADTIAAPDSAELSLNGLRVETTFFRVALDRLGILPQFHHIAEYKSAANRFLHPAMPDPQREMATSLLDSAFEEVVAAIARARRLSSDTVRQTIDQGVLSATEARERKFIDVVAFEDDLPSLLGAAGQPVRLMPWPQGRRRIQVPYRWHSSQRQAIGVVQLLGAIIPGESRDFPVPLPPFGRQLAGHETVARAFRLAEKLPQIKAIVFHVDSPGGSAVASDLIWREVARVQRTKPVVVHMGNVAGSGGYYVSCGARHIVAGATTLTGSIGVVSGKFNTEGFYAKAGLRQEVVARGATATLFSPSRAFTDREWTILRNWMDSVYLRFKARVAAGRQRSEEEIEAVARGRVWTGRQALDHRLVDEIGDFEAAVQKAKQLSGIALDAHVPVVTVRPPKSSAIPSASVAAWAEFWCASVGLLNAHSLLLMPPEVIS